MNTRPLAMLLDALAASDSMVPDEADRVAVRRCAEVIRVQHQPWMVVLVAGTDADPIAEEVESIGQGVGELHDDIRSLEERATDLLSEIRERRSLGRQLAAMRSVARQYRDGTLDEQLLNPHECEALRQLAVDPTEEAR